MTDRAFGAGPGLNLDFATFSFHVPSPGIGACALTVTSAAVSIPITTAAAHVVVLWLNVMATLL
jgi:hypothetical protein